jgi:Phage integrase family
VEWSIEVSGEKLKRYRDTRGPGLDGVRRLLAGLEHRRDGKAIRDLAIVHLLFDLALRRGELVGLDLEHLDLVAGTVAVLGKGHGERELRTLPHETAAALRAWIEVRSEEPGPLFVNFDRAGKGSRLTATSVYRMVRQLGERAGLRARPDGLRHGADHGGPLPQRRRRPHSGHGRSETSPELESTSSSRGVSCQRMAESDRERLPDIYYPFDYPVLLEIGRWVQAGQPDGVLQPERIAEQLGEPPAAVHAAVGRLWRDGKIDVANGSTMSAGEEYMVEGMLPPGLRETGLWRDTGDLAERLQRFVDAEATAAERTDPEQARKIRRWAAALLDLGVDFAARYSAYMSKPG